MEKPAENFQKPAGKIISETQERSSRRGLTLIVIELLHKSRDHKTVSEIKRQLHELGHKVRWQTISAQILHDIQLHPTPGYVLDMRYRVAGFNKNTRSFKFKKITQQHGTKTHLQHAI